MPTAYLWYIVPTAKEDRATLGSDPSALAVPYGMGRGPFLGFVLTYMPEAQKR